MVSDLSVGVHMRGQTFVLSPEKSNVLYEIKNKIDNTNTRFSLVNKQDGTEDRGRMGLWRMRKPEKAGSFISFIFPLWWQINNEHWSFFPRCTLSVHFLLCQVLARKTAQIMSTNRCYTAWQTVQIFLLDLVIYIPFEIN